MKWIKSRELLINENYNQAKSILKKKGLDIDNEDYKKIDDLTTKGYMGLFTKLFFIDDVDLDRLEALNMRLERSKGIIKNLKTINGLSVTEYIKTDDKRGLSSIEALEDDLTELEMRHSENKLLKQLPKEWKRKLELSSDEEKEKFSNIAREMGDSEELKPLLKKIARYNTFEDFNKELYSLYETIKGGLDYKSIKDKLDNPKKYFGEIKEEDFDDEYLISPYIVYDKNNILVAYIPNFKTSELFGSKAWCISTGKEYWDEYKEDDYAIRTDIYFIWDFNLPTHDDMHQIGTVRKYKGFGSTHDKKDNSIDIKSLSYFNDIKDKIDCDSDRYVIELFEIFIEDLNIKISANSKSDMFKEYGDSDDFDNLFEKVFELIDEAIEETDANYVKDFMDTLNLETLIDNDDFEVVTTFIDFAIKFNKKYKNHEGFDDWNFDLQYDLYRKPLETIKYVKERIGLEDFNSQSMFKDALFNNDMEKLKFHKDNNIKLIDLDTKTLELSKESFHFLKDNNYLHFYKPLASKLMKTIENVDDDTVTDYFIDNYKKHISEFSDMNFLASFRFLSFKNFLKFEKVYLEISESENPKKEVIEHIIDRKDLKDYNLKYDYIKDFISRKNYERLTDLTLNQFKERVEMGDLTNIDFINFMNTNMVDEYIEYIKDLDLTLSDIEFINLDLTPILTHYNQYVIRAINLFIHEDIKKDIMLELLVSLFENSTYIHITMDETINNLINYEKDLYKKLISPSFMKLGSLTLYYNIFKVCNKYMNSKERNSFIQMIFNGFVNYDTYELISECLDLTKDTKILILDKLKDISAYRFKIEDYEFLLKKNKVFDLSNQENIDIIKESEFKPFVEYIK